MNMSVKNLCGGSLLLAAVGILTGPTLSSSDGLRLVGAKPCNTDELFTHNCRDWPEPNGGEACGGSVTGRLLDAGIDEVYTEYVTSAQQCEDPDCTIGPFNDIQFELPCDPPG